METYLLVAGKEVVRRATARTAPTSLAAATPRHEQDKEHDGEHGKYHTADDDKGVVVERDLVGELMDGVFFDGRHVDGG